MSKKDLMAKRKRVRLHGKRINQIELVQKTVDCYLGNKGIEPMSISEIATDMGRHRDTIYEYLNKAVELGLLKKDSDSGRFVKARKVSYQEFKRFNEEHPITADPLVKEWIQDLLTRKGGEHVVSWRNRVSSVENICNTCHVTPKQLIKMSQKEIESVMKNYLDFYRKGLAVKKHQYSFSKKNQTLLEYIARICNERNLSPRLVEAIKLNIDEVEKNRSLKGVAYLRSQGLRDFLGYYGMTWRRGMGGVMSQRIVWHAKYADIRLTNEELQKADDYIVQRWGLDSDVYRWFWVGIESCARFEALYSMSLEYTKHWTERIKRFTYVFTAFESKTKHIKGGKWTKYITREKTQNSIDLLKQRNGIRIYESRLPRWKFRQTMREALSEIFLYLGKTNLYFYEHYNHVLRHIGAHYWLAKGNYKNHVIVAKIGGWNTVDEMIQSYGELPPEKILEAVEEIQIIV
jgi:predicted transcriptional regulator